MDYYHINLGHLPAEGLIFSYCADNPKCLEETISFGENLPSRVSNNA